MLPRRARSYAPFALAGALLALLGVLAVLQYRWIGEVSRAERQRLAASLRAAAERFADDLDLEVTRAFVAFASDAPGPADARADAREERLRERWRQWSEHAAHPRLLRELLLATRDEHGAWTLRRCTGPDTPCSSSVWTAEYEELRAWLEHGRGPGYGAGAALGPGRRHGPGHGAAWPVLGHDPATAIPWGFSPGAPTVLALRLDRTYIAGTLLPELAARHFGLRGEPAYNLLVAARGDPRDVIYRSDPALQPSDLHPIAAGIDLLAVRPFPELRGLHIPGLLPGRGPGARYEPGPGHEPGAAWDAPGPPPPAPRAADGGPRDGRPDPRWRHIAAGRGAWLLCVRPRGGSLEALVARTRTRNLALSSGVLALLGASVLFLAVSTRRAQALARQQLEFVAGVTHELHTPLAGIRSAAQNLKDGVVAEPGQVRRYGGLIEKESRRLADMLQQVLDFAGLHGARRALRRERVALPALAEEALASCRFLIDERGVQVETALDPTLPAVEGDPDALRAALRNLIQNAAKYGGGWLKVGTARAGAAVEVHVDDRGPGLDGAEQARVFEPFYRGPNATAAQVPGSGLGLSIVREVAAAHGGQVRVSARPAGGSRFTLSLPPAPGVQGEGP